MSLISHTSKIFKSCKLPDPNITVPTNDLFSSAGNFLHIMRKNLKERKLSLDSFVKNEELTEVALLGQTSAGRRPSIHIETGLLERVKLAGYGNLVEQFPQPTLEQFDEQLDKAEKLMADTKNFNGSDRKLISAAVRTFNACKFPKAKFTPSTVEHAAEVQINKSSSASFPYYKRKGLVLEELIEQANKIFKGFSDPWKYPITRGFRLQLRPSPEEHLNLKIRVMYPYPGVIILVEDCFIMPFVEHFINTETFYVIGRSGREIRRMLIKCFRKKHVKRITSSDITAFDQNACNDLIIMAFWIIRQQLKLSTYQNRVFINMVSYFCISYAISKSGKQKAKCFVKNKGIPSGSGFTNMIGSISNAIAFEYAIPGILASESVLICGDDNIFDSSNVDFQKYCNVFGDNFNWTIDPYKTKHFKTWNKLHFLGFDWINGERVQLPKLLINQMLWHTTFFTELDAYERELARAASVLLNAKNGAVMFRKIFPDVTQALYQGKNVRFLYLYSSAPPTSLPGVVSYYKEKANLRIVGHTQPLLEHLKHGWDIR